MLLASAAVAALWALYDRTGIRPEWIAPTLYIESGFNPALQNRAGAPYYGIGQNAAGDIAAAGATPAEYMTWSAEEQLAEVVTPYFARQVKAFGPLRSGTRVYQANFLPGTLPTARGLSQVIAWRGSAFYAANAAALDPTRDGAITVSDIALVVARAAAEGEVRAALAQAYALRPSERMTSPVYGADFLDPLWWLLAPGSVASYALGR